jgi:hypothetical protein
VENLLLWARSDGGAGWQKQWAPSRVPMGVPTPNFTVYACWTRTSLAAFRSVPRIAPTWQETSAWTANGLGRYQPPTKAARGIVLADRIEALQSASIWNAYAVQEDLFAMPLLNDFATQDLPMEKTA